MREGELRRPDLPNFRVRRAARGPVLPKILMAPSCRSLATYRRMSAILRPLLKFLFVSRSTMAASTATPRPPTIALSEAVFGYWEFLSKYI